MDRLGNVLPGVLRKRGLFQHAHASSVVIRAQEWLGKHVAVEGVKALSFKDNTLQISCENSIGLQECQMAVESLKTYLEQEFRMKELPSIRLSRA